MRISVASAQQIVEEIGDLVSFMKEKTEFTGTNSDLAAQFTQATGWVMTPSRLKRTMNQYRYDLKDLGVSFLDFRTASVFVCTTMPSRTFAAQACWKVRAPSTSTTHMRHEARGSSFSRKHRVGM
jgi:hypothetical protein